MYLFVLELITCGLGVFLFLSSFFPTKNGTLMNADIVGYIGILMIFVSIIHGMIVLDRKIDDRTRCISSHYLPLTKFYAPVMILALILFDVVLIFSNLYPGNDIMIFIILGFIFLVWLLLLIPEMNSKTICIHGNTLWVTDYFKSYQIPLEQIQTIKRSFYLTFVIKTNNRNYPKIKFKPIIHVNGPLILFTTPESVKEFIKLVDRAKGKISNK